MNKCIVFIYCWRKKKNTECWSSQTESTTSFLYQLNLFTVFRKEQKGKKEAAAETKRKKSDTASETEPESKRQKTTEDKKQTTEENEKEDDRAETEKNGEES